MIEYTPKYIYDNSNFNYLDQEYVFQIENYIFRDDFSIQQIESWDESGLKFKKPDKICIISLESFSSSNSINYYCYYDSKMEDIFYEKYLFKFKNKLKVLTYNEWFKLAIMWEII